MANAVTQPTLQTMYQDVLGEYQNQKEFLWKHRGGFVHYIHTAVANGLLDARLTRKYFRLEKLSYALDPGRDALLGTELLGLLADTHLVKINGNLLETPQYFWMRLAMTRALAAANPTRAALELYETLSRNPQLPADGDYPASIFNTQKLLFDTTRPVSEAGTAALPQEYYQHGWIILDDVANEFAAIKRQEDFIASIDSTKVPLHRRFDNRIQLAKADQIPVCDDIVATSFQVLHFDMGHPFLESDGQLFVSHVGIYLPKTTKHAVTAQTRLVELDGIGRQWGLSPRQIEQNLTTYVRQYGDGWAGHNTYRLACFVRVLDALSSVPELQNDIDKTVGQWFKNDDRLDETSAYQQEAQFYAKHGIGLNAIEHRISLQPGQLLLLDNTRVIHGRIGKRRSKELFNFMWGVQAITLADITALRQAICQLVAGQAQR
jgi:hypothetical protein